MVIYTEERGSLYLRAGCGYFPEVLLTDFAVGTWELLSSDCVGSSVSWFPMLPPPLIIAKANA